jgi:carboxymethylenebutenolidase
MCSENDCKANQIGRRDFVIGAAAGLASLPVVDTAAPAQDKKNLPTRVLDDPSIRHNRVMFKHNGKDTFDGYLARPMAEGIYPAVLVIAGNMITEEYISNTCVALAVAGFVGLAPNIQHPIPDDTPRNNQAFDKFAANHTELDRLDDVQAGASYLRSQPFVSPGGMGVLGFCRGGREALLFAARSRDIDAVIAFHPGPVQVTELARLNVPTQMHHGTSDRSVAHAKTQQLANELRERKRPVELFLYEKCDHGFLAYTRPFYNPDAAQLAWKRVVEFLSKNLKPSGT